MKNLIRSGLIIGLFILGKTGIYATPSSPLYIDDTSGNIGTVDLSTGTVTVLGNPGVTLTDIAFTSNGNLYGTSFTGLYSVNKTTAAASLISTYGVGGGGMNALVGSGAGLYAASSTTDGIYAIDASPFSNTTLTGLTGGVSAGDLAFAASGGALYDTLSNGNLDEITISGSTFTSTIVGNMGNDNVFGLATGDDGVTYAVAGTEVYTINLNTAVLTPLLDYSGHGLGTAGGTAFITEGLITAPEPSDLSLLAFGLIGLILFRIRKRVLGQN